MLKNSLEYFPKSCWIFLSVHQCRLLQLAAPPNPWPPFEMQTSEIVSLLFVLVVKALSYHTQRLMKEKKFDKEIRRERKSIKIMYKIKAKNILSSKSITNPHKIELHIYQ